MRTSSKFVVGGVTHPNERRVVARANNRAYAVRIGLGGKEKEEWIDYAKSDARRLA